MTIFVQIASGILFFYFAYCILLFFLQRLLLFPRHFIEPPLDKEVSFSEIEKGWLKTDVGEVELWFIPPNHEYMTHPWPAIIFAHGNGELIDHWAGILKRFASAGVGVLLVEYPGYGRSDGRPTENNILQAFMAAYDDLVKRQGVDDSRIVFFGRSLGGGVVCALSKERLSAALILLSTFTSVRTFASNYLLPEFFVRDPFDNLAALSIYEKPVLVIHGKKDNLVPYKHGIALYNAAQYGEMLTYNCGHNNCPPHWETFWKDVDSFLERVKLIGEN